MSRSQRVREGSTSRGSTAVPLQVDGEPTVNSRVIRDGHYIQDFNQLQSSTMKYKRSNNSDITFIGNKNITEGGYDDTLQFQNFTSSSVDSAGNKTVTVSKVFFGQGQGRLKSFPDHTIRRHTFGQTDLYDDDEPFFENTNPEDPIEIITTHPYNLNLPKSLVDHSSVSALDGVLQPLTSRSSIDQSSIDFPFNAFGVRGSVGDSENPRRKSTFVVEGYNAEDENKTMPFLDAIEGVGPVSFPTVIPKEEHKIKPFEDTAHYREIYFKKESKKGVAISTDISSVIKSGAFRTWDIDKFEKHPSFGSDYYEPGPDSFVFGGLKK